MKLFFKSMMLLAVAAMASTACNKEVDIQTPVKTGEMKTIRFSAPANEFSTRATLTSTDEANFTAAWVNGDAMEIEALSVAAGYYEAGTATWNGTFFETDLTAITDEEAGDWTYDSYYPGKESILFGGSRIQNGNAYNSNYDLMKGSISYDSALLGKDPDGGNLVIPMQRLTSMIYFHLKSNLNETLQSATLTVGSSNNSPIAATLAEIVNNGVGVIDNTGTNAITITFANNTAPSATDFQLWFNILPITASSLSLTVTTTGGKIVTLTNPNGAQYEAGNLYKIVKNSLNWQDITKGAEWSYEFTSKQFSANGTVVLNDKSWTLDGDGGYWTYDGTKGQQFGSGNAAYKTMTLSSNLGLAYGVQDIRINTSGASGIDGTVSVSVCGKAFKSGNSETIPLTTTATEYTFSSPDGILTTGDIIISFAQTSSKAIYVKKITVNRDGRTDPQFAYSTSSFTVYTGDTFTTPALSYVQEFDGASSITYALGENDDPTVASVDASTGAVTIGSNPGTVTVTASFPGNENFKPSSASYTITVNAVVSVGWVETNLTSIDADDVFVMVGVLSSSYYALPNDCTSASPQAVPVTISGNVLTSNVTEDLKWNVSGNASDGFVFSPANDSGVWLHCNTTNNTGSNTNIRVGTGNRKYFSQTANYQLVTKDNYTARYLSIYNNEDWRGYTTTDNAPEIKFYKYVDPRQDSGLLWSESSASATIATGNVVTFTAPTLTMGYATNVTYNSTNPSVATISSEGNVSILAGGTTKIQAIFAGNDTYREATAEYMLEVTDNREQCGKPSISPDGGTYTEAQTVTISTTTSGATIHYTTDGTDPTSNSTTYSGAITVNETMTIKAIAVKTGYKDSAVARADYTIGNTGRTYSYTFNANTWAAVESVSSGTAPGITWSGTKNGVQLTSGQGVQVTTSLSGVVVTSSDSFTNTSKIVVTYCTNASKGAGAIKVRVGEGTQKSFTVSKPSSGGTTLKECEFDFDPAESGAVALTVDCSANSIYIYKIEITAN